MALEAQLPLPERRVSGPVGRGARLSDRPSVAAAGPPRGAGQGRPRRLPGSAAAEAPAARSCRDHCGPGLETGTQTRRECLGPATWAELGLKRRPRSRIPARGPAGRTERPPDVSAEPAGLRAGPGPGPALLREACCGPGPRTGGRCRGYALGPPATSFAQLCLLNP